MGAPRPGDGLFIASDAPAMDQISITGDHPFTLPGVFRRLGATRATLVVADPGASQSHSHSRLVTYKVSVRPNSALELGGTFENHFGWNPRIQKIVLKVDRLLDRRPVWMELGVEV